jgi:hypothetical protein
MIAAFKTFSNLFWRGDLPEQHSPPGPRGCRKVANPTVKPKGREQGKCSRLDRLGWPTQGSTRDDLDGLIYKLSGYGSHQNRIGSPAARQNDLRRNEAQMEAVIQGERMRREFGESGKDIGPRTAGELSDGARKKRFAEKLAPGALGRRTMEILVAEPLFQKRLDRLTPCGQSPVHVHGLAVVREVSHCHVHENIARPSVERERARDATATPVERADVADASEVLDADGVAAPRKDHAMKHRRQRRPLPSGSDVPRPKIIDNRNSKTLGEVGRLANLESGGRNRRRIMEDRLTVQADGAKAGDSAPVFCIEPPKVVVQLAERVGAQLTGGGCVKRLSHGAWEIGGPPFSQTHGVIANLAQRVIHAIEAGAGHDAENEAFFHLQEARTPLSIRGRQEGCNV